MKHKINIADFFRKYMMTIALVAVTAVFALWPGKEGIILYPANIHGVIIENAYVFVLAAGMLLCILTGGNIDLSVGSVVCFTACIGCTLTSKKGLGTVGAICVMLLLGLGIGAFQGFWIAKVRIPPFIVTLAGMYAFRGLSNVVLNGMTERIEEKTHGAFLKLFGNGKNSNVPDIIREQNPELAAKFTKSNEALTKLIGENYIEKFNLTCMYIGILAVLVFVVIKVFNMRRQRKLGIHYSVVEQIISTIVISVVALWVFFKLSCYRGIPYVLIWIALVLGIYAYITNKTAIGRHLYAVGGNEKATALSGVNTRNVYWFAYANIGLLAGLAAILTAARAKGIDSTYGEGYEMDAIASCFIGGASAYGGVGSISGMLIGALLMGVINKGMIIIGGASTYQKVVKGLVLLVAVLFDVLTKRKKH